MCGVVCQVSVGMDRLVHVTMKSLFAVDVGLVMCRSEETKQTVSTINDIWHAGYKRCMQSAPWTPSPATVSASTQTLVQVSSKPACIDKQTQVNASKDLPVATLQCILIYHRIQGPTALHLA